LRLAACLGERPCSCRELRNQPLAIRAERVQLGLRMLAQRLGRAQRLAQPEQLARRRALAVGELREPRPQERDFLARIALALRDGGEPRR
jgi:hypothetical protein